jgi:hypothetical protein
MTFDELAKRAQENRMCSWCGHTEKEVGPINYADDLCGRCYKAKLEERRINSVIARRRE